MYRVGLVGAGTIGARRAQVAAGHAQCQVVLVNDVDAERARLVAHSCGAQAVRSWQEVVGADLDLVLVATTHHALAPIAQAALEAGKHVLIGSIARLPKEGWCRPMRSQLIHGQRVRKLTCF
jgi:predicted dehydrogenase